jgi:hypothetical protein
VRSPPPPDQLRVFFAEHVLYETEMLLSLADRLHDGDVSQEKRPDRLERQHRGVRLARACDAGLPVPGRATGQTEGRACP